MRLLAILRTYQAFLVISKRYYYGPFANIKLSFMLSKIWQLYGQVFAYNLSTTQRRVKMKTFLESLKEADQHGLVYDSVALI